jgi:beta-xylosidase
MKPLPVLRVSIIVAAALVLAFLFVANKDIDTSTSVHPAWASAPGLQEPVLNENFPDPAILDVDGTFYAFATNTGGRNIPVARSTDLIEWTMLADAMPELGPWVAPARGMVWAPETFAIGDEYRMYYTARDRASGRQCIGVASSRTPEGPYRDVATQALVCPPGYERAIDSHPYFDGKHFYLYFSAVCCDQPNGIFVQKLTPDGLATAGDPSLLLKVDATWEGTIAEAPTMVKHDGKLFLFYSGNDYRNQTYSVGYATCKTPTGPCSKAPRNPILTTGSSQARALGPGHQTIVKVDGNYWMLFHGWNGVVGYRDGGSRVMWLQPLLWSKGKPTIGLPGTSGE